MKDRRDRYGDAIGALAHPHRRETLSVLDDRQPPVALQELATAVDAAESDDTSDGEPATDGGTTSGWGDPPDGAVAADPQRRLAIELYHVHLPKLDDAGLVSFDPDSKEVEDWQSNTLLDPV